MKPFEPDTNSENKEYWLPLYGFEKRFVASSFGRVFSFYKQGFLIPFSMKSGHLKVNLNRCRTTNTRTSKYVNTIVLETFVGKAPKGLESRHLDGDPKNNKLSNLVWGTRGENLQDRKWHAETTLYKLTPEQVTDIKQRMWIERADDLSEEFGVHIRTIYDIRQGRSHRDVVL